MLVEVEANLVPDHIPNREAVKTGNRRKVRVLSPPLSREHRPKAPSRVEPDQSAVLADTPPVTSGVDDDGVILFGEDEDQPMSDPLPSSPIVKAVERKIAVGHKLEDAEPEDDLMDVAPVFGDATVTSESVNLAGSRLPPPKIARASLPTPENSSPPLPAVNDVDATAWTGITSKLDVINSSPTPDSHVFGKISPQEALEDDGSLRMFWLDYTEVNGSLCLFGKVRHKEHKSYVSAFVKVDNILRKLYFLPREYRERNGRNSSEEVEMNDVYEEVDSIMSKLKVGMHKIKPCARKYAFELPTIPKEADYLKLLYPYDKQQLPMDMNGETFSHVFGTNTSLFEQFVLWKNIMGPCWLKIEGADFTTVNNASWCKLECSISNPNTIIPLPDSENQESPRLTLMSLSFRTQLNVKENKQEILVASARVYDNVSLTDTTSPEKMASRTFTIMRPSGSAYPLGFEAETKKQRGSFTLAKSEQFLLSKFLALFEQIDPDVLMGHQLQDVDYSILLSRFKEKKTPGWHRIGRLKRTEWPKNFNRAGSSFFAERQLIAGRLMCDLANDMGKVTRAQTL